MKYYILFETSKKKEFAGLKIIRYCGTNSAKLAKLAKEKGLAMEEVNEYRYYAAYLNTRPEEVIE